MSPCLVLFIFAAMIFASSNAATPYTVVKGWNSENLVQGFQLDSCDQEWCELKEENTYTFKINMTAPFLGAYQPSIDFMILSEDEQEALLEDGQLPKFCDNLTKGKCPLGGAAKITYSGSLKIYAPMKLWNFMQTHKKVILNISFYVKNAAPMFVEMFSIKTNITLARCWPIC